MRVSVVGCGSISKCHLEELQKTDGIEISSVVDIKHDRADAAAEKYGCRAYYDFDSMLNEDEPDCIHICTPHYLHVPMAIKALSRDIHVLCEKPCAITAESLARLRLAQSMSLGKFGVCFQNRYNKSVILIKALIDSKKYGEVKAVRASVDWCRDADYYSDDWHGTQDKEGGGVMINQAIHTLDLMRYISGKKPRSIIGHVSNDHLKGVIEVEDSAWGRFEYEDGSIGIITATTAFGCNAPIMIDFFCEKATLRIEGDNAYLINDGNVMKLDPDVKAEYIGKNYWGTGHGALIHDFYQCIRENKKFPIDANEGGKAVEELLAIYGSSEIKARQFLNRG